MRGTTSSIQKPDVFFMAAAAVIFFLPLSLCFVPGKEFYKDWTNNVWLMNYFGEYFMRHASFPAVINADKIAGLPMPAFYGPLFYPAAGLLSLVFGGDRALRLALVSVSAVEFLALLKLGGNLSLRRVSRLAFVALGYWSVYSTTNLYNRAAIAEYAAVCLLTALVCLWLDFTLSKDRRDIPVFFFILTALLGTHAITASFGFLFLVALAALTLPFWKTEAKPAAKPVVLGSLFCLLVSLPWFYMLYRYSGRLSINGFHRLMWPASIDSLATRLALFPSDPRSSGANLAEISTPYLDAQINMPLAAAFFVALVSWRGFKRSSRVLTAGLAALGVFLIALSVSDDVWNYLPAFLSRIQFNYRLISYVDLSFLAGLAAAIGARRGVSFSKPVKTAFIVCVAWSAVISVMKLSRAYEISHSRPVRASYTHLPDTFYGTYAYDVPEGYAGEVHQYRLPLGMLNFPVSEGRDFGETQAVPFTLRQIAFVGTDARAFPWNKLLLDGRELDETYVVATPPMDLTLAAKPPGLTGTVSLKISPDPVWLALRTISLIVFALGAAVTAWTVLRRDKNAA